MKVIGAPKRIWLNIGSLDDALDDVPFGELAEVSWCADKQYDGDIEYVRADEILRLRSENTTLQARVERIQKLHVGIVEDQDKRYLQVWGEAQKLQAVLVELVRLDDQYRPDPAPHEWTAAWEAARALTKGEKE